MDPDRVIVGEVLGDEVIDMLNAMSQGNEGSMCTIHADSSEGAFARLAGYAVQAAERLPLEATNLIAASAIDLVVFMVRRGPRRFVASVREVVGARGVDVVTNEVFRPGPDGRARQPRSSSRPHAARAPQGLEAYLSQFQAQLEATGSFSSGPPRAFRSRALPAR